MTDTVKETLTTAQQDRALPESWRWARLGDVCKFAYGSSLPAHAREHGNVPVYGSNGVVGLHTQAITKRPTIVIGRKDSIGEVHLSPVPCWPIDTTYYIEDTLVEADMTWLSLLLKSLPLRTLNKAAAVPGLNREDAHNLHIPLPPLPEQRRIAAILGEQLAAVERARAAAEAQLEAARALPGAYLREVFESAEARTWPRRRLGDVCTLLPAKSIATNGDVVVHAITTACLTESGFNPSGVKIARMRSSDVHSCKVTAGEVLIARSNTPDLVGRAAMYQGIPDSVVASDLTIRLRPASQLESEFVAAYLSSLYLQGYWKVRAGGASGSMKKITRAQIQEEPLPVPGRAIQQQVVSMLNERILAADSARQAAETQLAAINALPAALLRQAFSGALSTDTAIPVEIRPEVADEAMEDIALDAEPVPQLVLSDDYVENGLAIAAYAVRRLHHRPTFGRVQLAKVLYLSEDHLGIELGSSFLRQAAGPLDERIYAIEQRASRRRAFQSVSRNGRILYTPGPLIETQLARARLLLGGKQPQMDALLDHIGTMNTERAEIIATLYGAWNDFLLDGQRPTDGQIIREVRENWHPSKQRFTPSMLKEALAWMHAHALVPRGLGSRTVPMPT